MLREEHAYELHAAAAVGAADHVAAILATRRQDAPQHAPNAPDADGRTAMFYAQLRGHAAVVELLEQHGWAKMPEGNMFAGPGGRRMWWASGEWGTARPKGPSAAPSRLRFTNLTAAAHNVWPLPPCSAAAAGAAQQPSNAQHMRARKLRAKDGPLRAREPAGLLQFNAVGPGHRMYMRKQPSEGGARGGRGKAPKPCLNTRDYAEAYLHDGRLVDAAFLLEEQRALLFSCYASLRSAMLAEEEAEEEVEQAAEAAPPAHSLALGEAARFVVARRPTRAPDGSWVVLPLADAQTEAAALCMPQSRTEAAEADADEAAAAAEEEAPTATGDEAGVPAAAFALADCCATFPALPAAAAAVPSSRSSEWELLSELDDEAASVVDSVADSVISLASELELGEPDAAEARPAWRGGAAATRAAVGFAGRAPTSFRAKPALPAVAEAEASEPTELGGGAGEGADWEGGDRCPPLSSAEEDARERRGVAHWRGKRASR